MRLRVNNRAGRLPKVFPVGATYVVEGHGGEHGELHVESRYIVLPTGRRINVPAEQNLSESPPGLVSARRRRQRVARSHAKNRPEQPGKKIISRGGTARQHGR
jgi:hypothetical protein